MIWLLDFIGGVRTESDSEARRQGRLLASIAIVGGVAASVCAVLYLLLSAWADAAIGVVSALGAPMSVLVWRVRRNRALVLDTALGYYLTVFVGAALSTQALAYLTWTAALPVVAFLGGGLALGRRWTLLTLGALSLSSAALVLFPFEFEVPGGPVVRLVRVITLIPTMAALGYFFERARQTSVRELAAAARTAQQATQVKSRLLAHVSHEIRTPLNGVLGLTQSLLQQPLPLSAHADLLLIQRSGTGLLALINDLLDTARAESGQLELHPAPVDVRQLVREVVALYRETARSKGLTLACDGEAEACWAMTDEVRLRQVLANLVVNALKFTDAGAVTVWFRRGPSTPTAFDLTLTVEDTGRGISTKDLPRLFEPFTQLHGDVAHEGSGLGLAISQQLATQLGGTLTVESTVGRGSLFTLRLLLTGAAAPPESVTTPKVLPAFAALVVDDNQINLRVARALLERLGAVVETAEDGEAAFTSALERPFDVVLMDLQMPRLDGIEATRRLRSAGFRAPIVALTASAGPETRDECLACGMNECLTKPLLLPQLRAVLEMVLGPGNGALPLLAPGDRPQSGAAPT